MKNFTPYGVAYIPVTNNVLACFQDGVIQIWETSTFESIKQFLPSFWNNFSVRSIAISRYQTAHPIPRKPRKLGTLPILGPAIQPHFTTTGESNAVAYLIPLESDFSEENLKTQIGFELTLPTSQHRKIDRSTDVATVIFVLRLLNIVTLDIIKAFSSYASHKKKTT
ncbi:hypothetical protein NQ317_004482 [Molorchus minor]|uniref:Uncharacterized protein n=1 Tax=Molorchus minor TaxID=1323400 RepID=A0ABQ9IVB2_9CUCU|nr:hypothetical protein NQ317_004482 [Molorchus minor]